MVDRSVHRSLVERAHELVRFLRYLDSAEIAREAANTLVDVCTLPEPPMVIVTALYTSTVVHYGRIFHGKHHYSEKHARREPGFRSAVHKMLMNVRHKLTAHMDIAAAKGTFGLVGRTITAGSTSVILMDQFSAQATGIAGPINSSVAVAIRDHTAVVASHLERAMVSEVKELSALAAADAPAFVKALCEAGYERVDQGSQEVTLDETLSFSLPPVVLNPPGRPIPEVVPENHLFRHLILEVRPRSAVPVPGSNQSVVLHADLPDDKVIVLRRVFLAHPPVARAQA